MSYINHIVASSNLIAIPLSYYIDNPNYYLLYFPMAASYVYHLAETKHGLVGVYPLNQYSGVLLNIDRLFALLSAIYILFNLYNYTFLITRHFILVSSVGVLSLMYSEKDQVKYFEFTITESEFTLTHVVWHFCAFYLLAYVINDGSLLKLIS